MGEGSEGGGERKALDWVARSIVMKMSGLPIINNIGGMRRRGFVVLYLGVVPTNAAKIKSNLEGGW